MKGKMFECLKKYGILVCFNNGKVYFKDLDEKIGFEKIDNFKAEIKDIENSGKASVDYCHKQIVLSLT